MVEGLTDRQKLVLETIADMASENGRPPSIPELMLRLGIASPNGVAKHLQALEAKGYIARERGARGVRLLTHDARPSQSDLPEPIYAPIVGDIAAGVPILAQENIDEFIPIPPSMTDPAAETFFLRVKGDSMIEEGIMPGDLVMVSKCDTVSNGELAAVMVEDEATVKRFFRRGGTIVLEPANANYEPIEIDPSITSCAVVGRIVGLLRSYRRRF